MAGFEGSRDIRCSYAISFQWHISAISVWPCIGPTPTHSKKYVRKKHERSYKTIEAPLPQQPTFLRDGSKMLEAVAGLARMPWLLPRFPSVVLSVPPRPFLPRYFCKDFCILMFHVLPSVCTQIGMNKIGMFAARPYMLREPPAYNALHGSAQDLPALKTKSVNHQTSVSWNRMPLSLCVFF